MKIIFIRHGEPDYKPCDEREFIGHGRDLAPLTSDGVKQAETFAINPILKDCSLIVSSPYTRALQTAAIISRHTGISINVEIDLHEWLPDKTFMYKTSEESFDLHNEFWKLKGVYPKGEVRRWETIEEIINRVVPVLNKYMNLGYDKIALVAHGGVIRRFTGDSNVKYCTAYEVDYYDGFPCIGWVD